MVNTAVLTSPRIYKIVLVLVLLLTVAFCFIQPTTQFRLGNLFFGELPSLYNVRLAQYFFTSAAYPLVGETPVYSHYQLSRTYFIQGELEISLSEARKELAQYPDNKRTNYILGLTYGYLNREEEAIEAFSEFIKAYPESWAARNDMAWLQFRIGDVEGALATLEPVSTVQNPWVQNTYGTLLLNNGKKVEAKAAFLLAEELVSNMTEETWGKAYPGNDPRVYSMGLEAMKVSITKNLELVAEGVPVVSPAEEGG